MGQLYKQWTEDQTTLEIVIDNDPSPAIELDQQEDRLEQWKIVPLSSPSRVICNTHYTLHDFAMIFRFLKLQ